MRLTKRVGSLFFLFVTLLVLDALSKYMVQANLPLMDHSYPRFPFGGIEVFQGFLGIDFAIVHATNTGAAYGIFSHYSLPLLLFRIGLIVVLGIYLLFYNRRRSWEIPLVLIVTGAVGNVIDTFVYGHVVDMFQLIFWGRPFAVFNVADTAITIGIVWLFLLAFTQKEQLEA